MKANNVSYNTFFLHGTAIDGQTIVQEYNLDIKCGVNSQQVGLSDEFNSEYTRAMDKYEGVRVAFTAEEIENMFTIIDPRCPIIEYYTVDESVPANSANGKYSLDSETNNLEWDTDNQ